MNSRLITTTLFVCALLPALPAFAQDRPGREGMFQGQNGVSASGVVVVTGAGVSLMRDFKLEGAEGAHVGLGRNGSFDAGTDMGALQSAEGSQDYSAGSSFNVSDYDEVWIWNPADGTPLAIAKIN